MARFRPCLCARACVSVPTGVLVCELRARTQTFGGPCEAADQYVTSSAVVGTAVPVCLAPWR